MKIKCEINNITGKQKVFCISDLIRYYGETRYKILEGIQRLNQSNTTKGMIASLLKKVSNNPNVSIMMNDLEGFAQKRVFSFTINDIDLLIFDDGKKQCNLTVEIGDEYFFAKAVYDMMKPAFKKTTYEQYVEKEKQDWLRWFTKNLQDYTKDYKTETIVDIGEKKE
jgi:hypothetical protein